MGRLQQAERRQSKSVHDTITLVFVSFTNIIHLYNQHHRSRLCQRLCELNLNKAAAQRIRGFYIFTFALKCHSFIFCSLFLYKPFKHAGNFSFT